MGRNVEELKQCLIDVWHGFEQSANNNAVDVWCKSLCVLFMWKKKILSNYF